jgi:hypothetical protein
VVIFDGLHLVVDGAHELTDLRVVSLTSVRPFDTAIAYDHIALAFARVMVADFNRGMLVLAATPVRTDG